MQEILIKAGCYVAVIVMGYVLRSRGFFGPGAFDTLSKIVLRITLPCAIIANAAGRTLNPAVLTISLIGLGGGLLYMGFGWLLARKKDRAEKAFYVVNLPGYNIGTFALPFTQEFLGPVGVLTTSIFDVGNAFVCLGGSYGVARAVKEGGRLDVWKMLKAPLTSIPFMTHVITVLMNLAGLEIPGPVVTFAGIGGNANAFLAMLMLGVGFRLSGDRSRLGIMAKVLSVRFGTAAVLALAWYFLLPFDLEVRQTLVILMFAPIGSAIPVYTRELGEDEGLSSAINSVSIVISIVIIVTLLTLML